MRKKREFTILERAMQTVDCFDKVYHKIQQQTILGSRSQNIHPLFIFILELIPFILNILLSIEIL